jgi:malate synthase
MDFEDSVACVDAQDKVEAYSGWLGLMKGDLTCEFEKAGGMLKRGLVPDMSFTSPDGCSSVNVRARALLLTRNVGLHMYTDMVMFKNKPVPECIVDSVVTIVAAMHDLLGKSAFVNSPKRCVYLVKPKLHSSAEVEHVVAMTQHIEHTLQLRAGTVKLMLMDEERRFSANFSNCLAAAKDRIFSTNTGFLDRTGNEFRCSCEAGPMLPKQGQRSSAWIKAYEQRNVFLSAAAGLLSVAQVGKVQFCAGVFARRSVTNCNIVQGMWAKPDSMADMMTQKSGHVLSGASNAWVPSPTAATLHALHYHDVSVRRQQQHVMQQLQQLQLSSTHDYLLKELLTIPIVTAAPLSLEQVTDELRGNIQSILGYTVHWVHLGVGCSKVPDISGENLMEDRATLRIAVQLVHNWLQHGVTTRARVQEILMDMAATVDEQNRNSADYVPLLAPDGLPPSLALTAAEQLIDTAGAAAQGYTEPVLHKYRALMKQRATSKL